MNFKMSLRALSRTKSSSVLSMCILILFPVMTLLLTSGPSSPLDDEEDVESPSSSPSDVLDLCRRRRCSSSLDRSLRRCLIDDAFLSSLSPRFRWRRSSLFDFPLLLDRLRFFLLFLDLLRSRSLDLERDPLPPLRSEDEDRDLDRRPLRPPRSFPSLSLERRSRSRRWRGGEADDDDDDGERPLLLPPAPFPSRSDFEGDAAAAAAGPPPGFGPSFSVSDMACPPRKARCAHTLSPGLSPPPSGGVLSPVRRSSASGRERRPTLEIGGGGGDDVWPSSRVGRRAFTPSRAIIHVGLFAWTGERSVQDE